MSTTDNYSPDPRSGAAPRPTVQYRAAVKEYRRAEAARRAAVLQRAGITVQHGYPREAVERLARPDGRPGRGRRTDLQRKEQQLDPDEAKEFAEGLRARARELYRRSDNVVLVPGDRAGPDCVTELRQEADALMTRAAKLDPTDTTPEEAP